MGHIQNLFCPWRADAACEMCKAGRNRPRRPALPDRQSEAEIIGRAIRNDFVADFSGYSRNRDGRHTRIIAEMRGNAPTSRRSLFACLRRARLWLACL